jgi:hypothetical protein
MNQRSRALTPAIPYIFLYDTTGQTGSAAGIFMVYDTIAFKTSDFHYTAGDDRILVQKTGFYNISFEASHVEKSGADWTRFRLYVNGAEVPGGTVYGAIYGTSLRANVKLTFSLLLSANDYVQIFADCNAGSYTIYANTIRFTMKFISTKGWNNSSGGRVHMRGGVER